MSWLPSGMPDGTDARQRDVVQVTDVEWVSVTKAAAILGVSRQTLARWDKDGRLPAHRTITNQRRYIRSEVEALSPTRAA